MSRLLLLSGIRYHLRHPLQLALAVLGVLLGVAVVVAVDVAAGSARRAFLLSAEAVSGRATHVIRGGPAGVPGDVYVRLRVDLGLDSVAPVVDRYVRVETAGGASRVLRLLGVDPFAERAFRSYVAPGPGQLDFSALLARASLMPGAATAGELGLEPGDSVRATTGTRTVTALIGGVLEPTDALARRALADLVIADIATAQEVTGFRALDRIELRVSDDADGAAVLDAVRGALPAGLELLETEALTGATVRMTRAFETNLTALALVALVFGMFLIYNSVTFSLVRRRPLIGLLRAQGVTAGGVTGLVLLEALLIGVVATALGMAAGVLLGSQLVALVARTVNDLYFTVAVSSVHVSGVTVVKGAALGVGATVAAAFLPARAAAYAAPRQSLARSTLERGTRRQARWLTVAGAAVLAVAVLMLAVPSRSIVLGFAALFVLILAAALLTPALTLALSAALRPAVAAAGPVGRLAARSVPASLSRTAPAIAALSVALAVGIAVTIMVGSFRAGVETWLDRSLQADLYISAPDFGADRTDGVLDPAFLEDVATVHGVAGITRYRHANLLAGDDIVRVIGVDLDLRHYDAFELLDGTAAAVWRDFAAGGVLASESFAWRRGLETGESVRLATGVGPRELTVAGVFRDYASEQGVLFIDGASYRRLWPGDDAVTNIAVWLADGHDADVVLARVRALPSAGGISARSNRGLREATIVVFDRTFVITGVLRLLALIVAFVGVTGALMALHLERQREVAVLRATGLTPRQVWGLVGAQSGLLGFIAAILAAPLGLAMAWAMVHVINRRSFGWSFDLVAGSTPFLEAALVGVAAALLAGVWPAWRMASGNIGAGLREE
ncbi:MAG TPA: FtsX-like permease family protein [Longimicrobiales bacterium]|nr:FtsX-like permease family protein [Longimicrobiales bacterium]